MDVYRGSSSAKMTQIKANLNPFYGRGIECIFLFEGKLKNRTDIERCLQAMVANGIFAEKSEVNYFGFANSYLCLGPSSNLFLQKKIIIKIPKAVDGVYTLFYISFLLDTFKS